LRFEWAVDDVSDGGTAFFNLLAAMSGDEGDEKEHNGQTRKASEYAACDGTGTGLLRSAC